MCKIISICNQKGGVGKTNVTVNLGIGLAHKGKRVLVVDSDPQGTLTNNLGYDAPALQETLATIYTKNINDEPIAENEAILEHNEGIYLMPSNITLSAIELSIVSVMSRESRLREYLTSVKSNYDYILIDCPPSLGMLTMNALTASDSILIPLLPRKESIDGLKLIIKSLNQTKRFLNPSIRILGIVFTMTDSRTTFTKNIIETIQEDLGEQIRIFDSIPHSIRAAEISAIGCSIYKHDPRGKVADAYEKLTEGVLSNE